MTTARYQAKTPVMMMLPDSTTTHPTIYSERRDDVPTVLNTSNRTSKSNYNSNQNSPNNISNPKRTKRKRKRSNFVRYTDVSFLWLFLRVGFVVCFIGYTSYQTYQRLFHIQQQATTLINSSVDDDSTGAVTTDTDTNSNGVDTSSSSSSVHNQPPRFQLDYNPIGNENNQPQQQIPTTLPNVWNLSSYALQFDAYAIAEWYKQQQQQQQQQASTKRIHRGTDTTDLTLFWQAAAGLRTQFAELYGGENAARAILDRAMTTFGNDVIVGSGGGTNGNRHHPDQTSSTTTRTATPNTTTLPVLPDDLYVTTCRVWSSKQATSSSSSTDSRRDTAVPTFRFAFGGYSVTVGRGNLFSQSFPFIMEQQLQTVFSLLGIQLKVQNAAMYVCHFTQLFYNVHCQLF
jgi:hypothetical protein